MKKQQKKRLFFSLSAIVILLLISACSERSGKAFYEADITDVHIDSLIINRYEKFLFRVNPDLLAETIESYKDEYPVFLGGIKNETSIGRLHDFITDPFVVELYTDTYDKYKDFDTIGSMLHEAFRYYRHHFPERNIPEIHTYVSGVDYLSPVKYYDDHLVIGLDSYLGAGHSAYDELGIPRYISRWMRSERVVADVMLAMADARLVELAPPAETLLDYMILHGKRQYFLDCMLPGLHDSIKIAYTNEHLKWIDNSEAYVWIYKLDNNLLYSKDPRTISGFINKAPFTSVFGNHSAPRTGVWMGWQIVREYMRRHPDLSLEELLTMDDSGAILAGARYRPR